MIEFIDSFAHSGEQGATPAPLPITYKWTSVGGDGAFYGTAANGYPVRASGHCIQIYGVSKTLTYVNERYAGVAYYIPGSSDRGSPLSFGSGGTILVQVTIEADFTVSVYAGSELLYNTGTDGFVYTADVYHYIELYAAVDAGNPISVTAKVNIDGVQRIDTSGLSNIDTSGLLNPAGGMNQVTLAGAEGGGDVAYACDFYCLNTNPTDIFGASNANVSFLGDVGIYATMPVQDGVVTWQPVPSVPQSYVNVNSIPPQDDNAYVYTDTINNGETFLFQPILGFNGTIFGAQLVIYAKKDAEGTRAFKPAIAGSTFVGPSIPDNYLFDYYDYFTFPMDSNNGVAWTPANFNSQNFGAVLTV